MSRRKIDETSRKSTASGMSILKRVRVDSAAVDKIVSETDDRIHMLYETQSKVDVSLDGMRNRFKEFAQPTVFKQLGSSVQGQRSLQTYSTNELAKESLQELRDCGLNDEEIDIWITHGGGTEALSTLSTSTALKMNPEVLKLRLEEIQSMIRNHKEQMSVDRGFSSAVSTSRLKLQLEQSLNQGRSDQSVLSHLVMKPLQSQVAADTPESQLKQIASDLDNIIPSIPDYGNPFPNPWTPVTPKLPSSTEFVGPKEKDSDLDVSDDDIFKDNLKLEEIRRLPKFFNYIRGPPSSVLYIKNLGSTVKHDHLIHLFGRFRVPGDDPITVKLMTGKMRGQAFVTCADIETASRCLYALCGYSLRGRPMIISFKQSKSGDSRQLTTSTSHDT